jgi:peptidoglycan/xylan/chitin deacetylase (PgdA/CDA1 family)
LVGYWTETLMLVWIVLGTPLVLVGLAACIVYALGRIRASGHPQLLCLMYHHFLSDEDYSGTQGLDRKYSISVGRFDAQLGLLRELGYQSVLTQEAHDFVCGTQRFADRSVLITIDDGYQSALTLAEPLLRRHGFRATLFVTTDPGAFVFDGTCPAKCALGREELRSIDPAVIDIQSHCVTHRPLVALSDSELERELLDSRASLESLLGKPVRFLSLPGGWHNQKVRQAIGRSGYTAGFVSDQGVIRPADDLLRLPRVNVSGMDTMDGFHSLLTPGGIAARQVRGTLKRVAARCLGPRRWLLLRSKLNGFGDRRAGIWN